MDNEHISRCASRFIGLFYTGVFVQPDDQHDGSAKGLKYEELLLTNYHWRGLELSVVGYSTTTRADGAPGPNGVAHWQAALLEGQLKPKLEVRHDKALGATLAFTCLWAIDTT